MLYLVALCALPPVLLIASYVVGNVAQDQRVKVIVQLQTPTDIGIIVAEHSERYDVDVLQSWNAGKTRGYRATVHTKQIPKIEADRRVVSVERLDS